MRLGATMMERRKCGLNIRTSRLASILISAVQLIETDTEYIRERRVRTWQRSQELAPAPAWIRSGLLDMRPGIRIRVRSILCTAMRPSESLQHDLIHPASSISSCPFNKSSKFRAKSLARHFHRPQGLIANKSAKNYLSRVRLR